MPGPPLLQKKIMLNKLPNPFLKGPPKPFPFQVSRLVFVPPDLNQKQLDFFPVNLINFFFGFTKSWRK